MMKEQIILTLSWPDTSSVFDVGQITDELRWFLGNKFDKPLVVNCDDGKKLKIERKIIRRVRK